MRNSHDNWFNEGASFDHPQMLREDTELITSLLESGCVDNIDVRGQETCRNQKLLLSKVFYDSPQQIYY